NVDFQDVRTVMLNAGAAVMGSVETRGDNRAKSAAEGALSSPLLDNRDIMGAKRILLSIISGVEAELQMDELTEITEYIQEQAGEDAEMIFGHGVDPDLGDRIRVTVIATGFATEAKLSAKKEDAKKVHDLDRSQGWLFQADNSVNNKKDFEVRTKPPIEPDRSDEKPMERELVFSGPFNKIEEPKKDDNDGEEGLFADDDFDIRSEQYGDQVINDDGMMQHRSTKQRLQQQAKERQEKMKQAKKGEMTKDEFNEKWSLPAYLRRGVKMQDVPHSSEPFISKYNLNDDNSILGNNKFLHDNVD
ncbi:MAG: cell division protein FtsZ, partial [Chryseolinea sp.]